MRLSLLYVLSVPYVAGFACFGGPRIEAFRLTGWVFVGMLVMAPLVFIFDSGPSRFPIRYWIPWIAMVLASIVWVDEIGRWQIQDTFQILTPFVIAPIASKAIKRQQDVDALLRGFTHCLIILLVATGLHFLAGVAVLVRAMALTAALVGCVFVAQIRSRPIAAVVGWSGCLLITGLTGSRIATVALLLEWVVLPGYRRLWSRLIAGSAVFVVSVALFVSPVFQQRFFGEGGGTIGDIKRGEFQSAGRFEAWPELFDEVKRRPWIGAGISSSSAVVKQVWERSTKPHNDYLRILLEQGVLGLSCFLFGVTCQLMSLRNDLKSVDDGRASMRNAAILGFFTLLVSAITDNPIVYGVWFMHPLLVLAGASYPPSEPASTHNHLPDSSVAENEST